MKAGTKLKSAVCDTEVMVIRGGGEVVECGGVPMTEIRAAERAELVPAYALGTLIGKRYVNGTNSVELLCTKPGKGSLSIASALLRPRDAQPLPSSD